jgi:cation diffusion facilitator CzcD-associated flavoprotein CzcO
MSGIAMAIKLRDAGLDNFVLYEKADSVGGTWRENRYPGLTCDVPSYFYSYSFEPNPDWSHRFSPGPEIRAYFERVARDYGVLPFVRFNERVARAQWDGAQWHIELASGERTTADFLITATGALHQKKYPEIPGLQDFQGKCFHSADWDDDAKLEGQRIGVIGNGSTGVQMMKPLSEVARELTLFQRTPQWIAPMGNKPYSESHRKRARNLPWLVAATRKYYQLLFESFSAGVVQPGRKRRTIADRCRKHLATVEDAELRAKLTPDYEPMCKRLIVSLDFYPTLQKENVNLVVDSIDRVEAGGVVTADGTLHELDILVLATGFDAHAWGVEEVVNQDGLSLKQAWAQGTRAYRSVAMPGFPNFFMLVGPNSPIGNISLIDISEVQAEYIIECIEPIAKGQAARIEPDAGATRAFHETLLDAMQDTVWVTGCDSWYLDENGVPITWPWTAKKFHQDMRRPDFSEFQLT